MRRELLAGLHQAIYREQVKALALDFIRGKAAEPCECPRPPNASGDRECVSCKAREALKREASPAYERCELGLTGHVFKTHAEVTVGCPCGHRAEVRACVRCGEPRLDLDRQHRKGRDGAAGSTRP